ncbi:M16 family metallopeptidase [Pedobacter nutrimenti]|uniref:Zinc protease n=1 Tax=Pedobacter nutrimenti TaxID=1241337 RepID=A0A318UFA0_9SPHI|nr:M16 family metallopeptidase [Pedobacter nutrimenti]PYF75104.1 zinc protease [Pedobacter nutrimenti]
MYKNQKLLLTALLAGIGLPALTTAQVTKNSPPKKQASVQTVKAQQVLPLDPTVRVGKLPNGFTYYIRQNKEPKNRVVMYLANKIGSILETDQQQGLAHFMEHMSFNGTKHFPKSELINYLQKSGVRFGADLNAYTGFDETVYQLPLPSDNPEILKNGLQIMRDWAQDVTLDPVEIDKERGVILEEKRLDKGASERMDKQTFPILLNQSRYASRLPIGTEEVLLNFKPEEIRSYYRDWYRPNLQALIVVGDIDVNKMEQSIKAKFSDLKNPVREKPRTKYRVPLTGKNQFVVVTDKEMPSTVAQVVIKHTAPELKTESDYRSSLIRGLFNQMLSHRYKELSRQADPPFLEGGAGIEDLLGGLDNYTVTVSAKPGELEKGFKAVWRESRRLQLFGFTQTELDRAKQNYLSRMDAAVKEKDKTASQAYVEAYLQHFLKQIAVPGLVKDNELVHKFIPGITLAELNGVSKEYIQDTNRDIVIMAPDKDKATMPAEAKVLGWIDAVNAEKLEAYKDNVNTLPLLVNQPVTGKIATEEKDVQLGITRLTLSNGVKVILKKTDFKNNQILFRAFSNGGTSLYSDADFQSASKAAGLVAAGGLGNYTATQLDKFLSGKQLKVKPYISERSQGFSGSSTPGDLETALQLVYGYVTEPRKDPEIFKGIIANAKDELANRSDDPEKVFGDTVNAVLSNYNVRRTGPSLEKISQISLDRAFEIYKERFSNAADLTFTFVGSIDEAQIKPLLEKYLGSLPSTGKKEEAKNLGIGIPEGVISKTVHKGSEPKATVYLIFSGSFDYSYENDLKLEAIKEALEIRMTERLREEEGGVYTPGVDVGTSKFPEEKFSLVVSFGCAPANVERLIASAVDEVNKLKKEGPLLENVNKFKAEDVRRRETELKTNVFWLNYLNEQLLINEPLNKLFDYDATMNKISVSSLKEIAAKYLTGKNYIRLVLLPETK